MSYNTGIGSHLEDVGQPSLIEMRKLKPRVKVLVMTELILGAWKGKGYPGAVRGESGDFSGPKARTPTSHYQEPGFKVPG